MPLLKYPRQKTSDLISKPNKTEVCTFCESGKGEKSNLLCTMGY